MIWDMIYALIYFKVKNRQKYRMVINVMIGLSIEGCFIRQENQEYMLIGDKDGSI